MKVIEFGEEVSSTSGFDGFGFDTIVQLRPRGEQFAIDLRASGSFRAMWDAKGQRQKWAADFKTALPDLSLIAIGRHLDDYPVPEDPEEGSFAMRVTVASDLFDIFTQRPATEQDLRDYVRGKIGWGWRFQAEPTRFDLWDARRLRVDKADLDHAAFPGIGTLWRADQDGYSALPRFASQLTEATDTTAPAPPPERHYDVALSFAGEQRGFVQDVATALRHAGVEVFYDDFEDLWGKDLTKEFENVFRRQSRFVVVFVSREYLAKAWTNLERQHALAGRIERMDDSVLPVRFDHVELPGLPATVGYREVGTKTPQELAVAILAKVRKPK